MSFCPKCKYEYQPGVLMCPDCNVQLVDRLPEAPRAATPPDDSWIEVAGVGSGLSTDLAMGALENANIPSTVITSSFGARGKELNFSDGIPKGALNVILVPKEFSNLHFSG